ncbi:stage IV sporulation protein FA [Pullulanibacillus camelliae]|uniref:Stage IV sporulation protein FA n=1 Tax=Pullulanibacillus camelliae TaxID=1707096 RepID=A0A8J2YHC8_9BACL|nr:M23 family metallopeptidase [Pullulanibacillus camelliae]GGE42715.1 stage IV sporulation protein FA [Pullulanibacillus camelliae]
MNRMNEIKRRHKQRSRRTSLPMDMPSYRPIHQENPMPPNKNHPLFKTNIFIMKCLIAAILVLGGAILYKTNMLASVPKAKSIVSMALNDEMNFTVVSKWYEKAFGQPLAFLPTNQHKSQSASGQDDGRASQDFAVPVSGTGTVTEGFSSKKKGITVEAAANAEVKAIDSGLVIFVGNKAGIGKTVVIQHKDGKESWYGKLRNVDVKQYDNVKKDQKLGTVTTEDGKNKGSFYFAIKNGKSFVDPIQVISFD